MKDGRMRDGRWDYGKVDDCIVGVWSTVSILRDCDKPSEIRYYLS